MAETNSIMSGVDSNRASKALSKEFNKMLTVDEDIQIQNCLSIRRLNHYRWRIKLGARAQLQ